MYCKKLVEMSSNEDLLINLDGILNHYNEPCPQLDSNISLKKPTNRVFVVGHKVS